MDLNIALLKESFAAIAPHANTVADHFYGELFSRHPESKELFKNVDLTKQKKALINSLSHIVEFIEDGEHLPDYLQKLGARHLKYGTQKEHFSWVGEALLATLAYFFDSDWSAELNQTWSDALRIISNEMIKGMETQIHTPVQRIEHKTPTIEQTVRQLANELFKKAIDDTFHSEATRKQIRALVQEMIQKAIAEEASKILSSYRSSTQTQSN